MKYTILPPSEKKHAHFGRHTDRATGVRPWFKPLEVEYEFTYFSFLLIFSRSTAAMTQVILGDRQSIVK